MVWIYHQGYRWTEHLKIKYIYLFTKKSELPHLINRIIILLYHFMVLLHISELGCIFWYLYGYALLMKNLTFEMMLLPKVSNSGRDFRNLLKLLFQQLGKKKNYVIELCCPGSRESFLLTNGKPIPTIIQWPNFSKVFNSQITLVASALCDYDICEFKWRNGKRNGETGPSLPSFQASQPHDTPMQNKELPPFWFPLLSASAFRLVQDSIRWGSLHRLYKETWKKDQAIAFLNL